MTSKTKRGGLIAVLALFIPLLVVQIVAAADDTEDLRGIVESRPADTITGTWVIEGFTFTVDATTDINTEDAPLELGGCAEVRYTPGAATPVATELKGKLMIECDEDANEVEVHGIVDSFPPDFIGEWVVDGVTYTTNASTTFAMEHGPFAIGACVEVEYDLDAPFVEQIKTDDDCDGVGDEDDDDIRQRVYGTLNAFPEDLIGDWVVGTVTYTANANTEFEQDDGIFELGACVKVDFAADTLRAIEIDTAESHHCGANGGGGHDGEDLERYGLVDSFPAELVGIWVIDGEEFQTGNDTEFAQEDGDFAVGGCVEIKYLPDTNVALKIETEDDYHCGGDGDVNGSYQVIVGNVMTYPNDLIGNWIVDGVTYAADDTTIFKENDGAFAVGTCVEIEFQTANSLAVEIETEDAYHCGDSIEPGDDDSAELSLNHGDGAAGSHFVFTGDNFPADSVVTLFVDGTAKGLALTNSNGWVTFAFNSDNSAGRASSYNIAIAVDGQMSNAQTVTVNNAAPTRNLPANYSASVISATSAPTMVALNGFGALSVSNLVLISLTILLLTVGTLIVWKRVN